MRYRTRKGAAISKRPSGRIDKIVCSNNRVKSNPPRQRPAYGPNVSSIRGHDPEEAILGRGSCSSVERHGEQLSDDGNALYRQLRAQWSLESHMGFMMSLRCGVVKLQNVENSRRAFCHEEDAWLAPEYMTQSFGLTFAWARPVAIGNPCMRLGRGPRLIRLRGHQDCLKSELVRDGQVWLLMMMLIHFQQHWNVVCQNHPSGCKGRGIKIIDWPHRSASLCRLIYGNSHECAILFCNINLRGKVSLHGKERRSSSTGYKLFLRSSSPGQAS